MTALAQSGSPQQQRAAALATAAPPPSALAANETPPPLPPPSAAPKSTTRHWRALRNALLSHASPTAASAERVTTASAVSTEFFPVFSARRCCSVAATGATVPPQLLDDNFEWLEYELAPRSSTSPVSSSAVAVRVREKKASARVTVAELLSHKVNRGVDNTGNVRTWPSEQLLLAYLLRNRVCQNLQQSRRCGAGGSSSPPLSVCELGSGMAGLASLGLLAHAPTPFARVDITDGNPQSVANLELCVAENAALIARKSAGARASARLLRWDRDATFAATERQQFDLLLASDCLFFEEFHVDLAHTIRELLRPESGRCFLLQPSRNGSMERFAVIAEHQGLVVERCDAFDADVTRRHGEYSANRDDYVPDVHLPVLLVVTAGSLLVSWSLLPPPPVMKGPPPSGSDAGNVRVCCRVRPANNKELQIAGAKRSVNVVGGDVLELKTGEGPPQKFTYDHVFSEADGQRAVFECVARPVVQDIMAGYNATIFAYGQTSSGKTYTMEGASIDDPELRGIIPRTATEIFSNVMAADENIEFIVKVSYIEIYMERIRDLLDPYKSKVNLQVREDLQRGIFVEGMTEVCVTSDDELLSTMRDGAANRAVAATGMNEGSSRSHSVFMVTLYQRNLANQATKAGKLYLVDLAGSEMVRKTGASGRQLEEAKTINKSLSALGMVINALTDANSSHVPYRDSKLTRVLQESLGGNSRTALIINVSPSSYNTPETLSTLRFGNRAKSIKNKAVVNEQRSVEEYKILLAKAEKALATQQNYIISLEARLGVGAGDSSAAHHHHQPAPDLAPAATSQGGAMDSNADGVGAADLTLDLSVLSSGDDPSAPRSPTLRAARAVEELQEKVAQLEEELAEEKQESTRRGEEIRLLAAKVQEQAHALDTSKTVIEEVQKVKELVEKSSEERVRQREALYAELKADFERLSFEHKELVIHAETVQSEYDALLQDLPPTSATSPGKLASAIVAADAAAAAAAAAASPPTSSTGERKSEDETDEPASAGEAQAASLSPSAESVAPTAGASGDGGGATASSEPGAEASGEAEAASAAGESSMEPLDWKSRCAALESELRDYEREYRQMQAAVEREKSRAAEDLERKKAQIRELELQIERSAAAAASSAPSVQPGAASPSSSGMSARERQHMRSIQQKLEQLVAVHRQLLRKYASLELELSEAKKKLVLRDERIKQVEANNRIMAGNMRAQAEKHVEELTHLRDQIADFRGAQRSHFEAQMSKSADAAAAKTLRGGSFYNDGVIRPIRGGGRRSTVLMGGGGGANAAATGAATGDSGAATGFLTRLFGKGS